MIPICLSCILGERTVIVLPVAQLFSRPREAVRCLCLWHHRLIPSPICLVQTQQYILVKKIFKDAISGKDYYIFVLHDMGVDVGVGRGLVIRATLVGVVETVLLLLGSEQNLKFG
jgi:hypothetical protein